MMDDSFLYELFIVNYSLLIGKGSSFPDNPFYSLRYCADKYRQ